MPIPAPLLGLLGNKLFLYGIAALSVVAMIWGYGHIQYREGRSDEKLEWQQAMAEMREKASESASAAAEGAIAREAAFAERVVEEKERIEEAKASGDSPFDVLFGELGSVHNAYASVRSSRPTSRYTGSRLVG